MATYIVDVSETSYASIEIEAETEEEAEKKAYGLYSLGMIDYDEVDYGIKVDGHYGDST